MNKHFVQQHEIEAAAHAVAAGLLVRCQRLNRPIQIYPVPRGGVPAAYAIQAAFNTFPIVKLTPEFRVQICDRAEQADVIVDDLIDSGKTWQQMKEHYPDTPFEALIHKGVTEGYPLGQWLVFPWEGTAESSIDDAFTRLIQFIGEDPARGGLVETPKRMAAAWQEWTSGYKKNAVEVLKTFEDGGELYDEMVHVANIPFYSQCEHHLAPFFGTVTFAYIPDKRIVGLSKFSRLVDVFARRLQVQERLTRQVLDCFCEHLNPLGAGITIRARHLCMESRGTNKQGSVTTTSAFSGVLRKDPAARAEFFSLAQRHGN